MPLLDLQPGIAVVQCVACREIRRIATARLTLGTDAAPGTIMLPKCRCGATEMLNRTIDTIDKRIAGTDFDLCRRRVNALADQLMRAGRVVEQHRAWLERHPPSDLPETT